MRTLLVDDEPLAIERMRMLCARIDGIQVIGSASDGSSALRDVQALAPDLVLLDVTMPGQDGIAVARALARQPQRPTVIFVTAHDQFAVEAFDCEAADYVLKPVAQDRLERAIERARARRSKTAEPAAQPSAWLDEFWVPHRSELIRLSADAIDRIDAERDYVRLHVADRSYLLLHTIQGLEDRLDPSRFIRLHRSTITRRACIAGLRHDGLGVWSAELTDGTVVRIGRTYLAKVKAMAGR
jgi:two-component system response regulator AlgR